MGTDGRTKDGKLNSRSRMSQFGRAADLDADYQIMLIITVWWTDPLILMEVLQV